MHRIIIVGAGFSGTLVAVQLLRQSRVPVHITLIERRQAQIAAGVAYSTHSACHLLNVPAGNMSALPDHPDHFLNWARMRAASDEEVGPDSFLPRRLFGDYLRSLFNEALQQARPGCHLDLVIDEVVAMRPEGAGARVQLRGGRSLAAEQVVLALGNFPPGQAFAACGSRYHAEPWAQGVIPALLDSRSCLIIGTGLTMVDLAVELAQKGYSGRLHVLSRRGLLPNSHVPGLQQIAPPLLACSQPALRGLLQWIRREIEAGNDWRACIDALRPVSQTLWCSLSLAEQQRFLRHLRPYWDCHRHRLAPEVARQLQVMLDSGQIIRHVGRIESMREEGDGVLVRIRRRHGRDHERLQVERVVNCTGPESDYRKLKSPLIEHLLGLGLVRSDALGLGLAVASDGALRDATGQPSSWLYTVGPVQKGTLWETTAVPELRQQAQDLASTLLSRVLARRRCAS